MYLLKHKDDTVAVIEIFGSDVSCIRVNDIVNHHLLPLCARHDIEICADTPYACKGAECAIHLIFLKLFI